MKNGFRSFIQPTYKVQLSKFSYGRFLNVCGYHLPLLIVEMGFMRLSTSQCVGPILPCHVDMWMHTAEMAMAENIVGPQGWLLSVVFSQFPVQQMRFQRQGFQSCSKHTVGTNKDNDSLSRIVIRPRIFVFNIDCKQVLQ